MVVIELGANDGLRGLPLRRRRANLERMIKLSQAAGAKVLLVGMRMPPNLGRDYTQGFERNFSELAKLLQDRTPAFPAGADRADRGAFQADNLHPSPRAQPKLRDHVWKSLAPLLEMKLPLATIGDLHACLCHRNASFIQPQQCVCHAPAWLRLLPLGE